MLTIDILNKLWPHGDSKIPGLRAAMVAQAPEVFAKWKFDTDDIVAIFFGQVSEECGAGTEVVENLNYTAKRMMAVWPSRFPTLASALPYAGSPQKLANKVYNGRMGNRPNSDDGYTYRGRGATQTTGHDGYAALAEVTGLDLLGNPDLVNDVRYFLESAAADFVKCGCLPFARRGDIEGVTHHLNGGLTNLASRKAWTAKFRSAMAVVVAKPVEDGVLRMGAKGFEVKALQQRLVDLGYTVGTVDGDFGRGTRMALKALQLDRGLPDSGEVDAATKEALKRDLKKPVAEARANATEEGLREAGSGTIARGDSLTWWGKALAFTGVAGGGGHVAQTQGLIESVKDTTDHVSAVRDVAGQVQDVGGWLVTTATTYWWAVLLLFGYFGIKYGRGIVQQRLADHRAAFNMKL